MSRNWVAYLVVAGLGCTFLNGNSAVSTSTNWKVVKPSDGKPIALLVKGNKRNYFKLNPNDELVVKVSGPNKLKLLARAVLSDDKEESFSFITNRDGDKRYHTARVAGRAKSVTNPSNDKEIIGNGRSVVFKVPDGDHEFRITLPDGAKEPIYIRFLTTGPKIEKKPVDYIAYLPLSYDKEVKLVVNEHEYIYYRGSESKPIEIEVNGPTKVKVVSRLEFDHTMRGEKQYRVQVSEGDQVILTEPVKTGVSGTATYSEKSSCVLGKGKDFYIEVPSGKHRYQIKSPDSSIGVIFRFYLPQRDLGNELSKDKQPRAGLLKHLTQNRTG